MHHYTNKNTIRHFHPTGKIQSNVRLLIKKNIELEKRLTTLEITSNQLESKVFETSARVSQAELRAGRFDMRASEASQRAAYAQERAAEAIAAQERAAEAAHRAAEAAHRAAAAEERAAEAAHRAAAAEERAIRLEIKWMKITRIIKMPLRMMQLILHFPKQLLSKLKTVPSPADTEKIVSTQTAPNYKDEPLSPSLRAQQIYQNLKTPDAQLKDTDKCE